jgi:ABC-2 type transport system ATP-binding protein
MARSEMIDLFRHQADEGLHVLVSSHILHEVDDISDRVVLLNGGYVVAEGDIEGVREEVREQPLQVLVRCDRPEILAARMLTAGSANGGGDGGLVTEVVMHEDRRGLLVRARDADRFYLLLNRLVLDEDLAVEAVAPADADVGAVYQYLIVGEGGEA